MAKNVEEIVLVASDQATAVIENVANELGSLGPVLARLATSTGPVGLAIGAVVAAVGGAAGAAVMLGSQVSRTVEELDGLAASTGVSVEALQVLNQQMEEAGATGSLATALSNLNRSIEQGDPLLAKLGITTRDTLSAFLQLGTIFSNSADTAKKTEIAVQLLGAAGKDLVGTLPILGTTFKQMDADMRASGNLIGGTVAQQARDLDKELDTLGREWSGTLSRIKQATVPWAKEIVRSFNDVWDAAAGRDKSPAERAAREIEAIEKEIADWTPALAAAKKHPGLAATVGGQTAEMIDERLAALRLRLGKLKGLRAETEQEEADIMAAFDAAARRVGGDSLSGVTTDKPDKDKVDSAAKARAERLLELQRVMGVTRAEAVRLAEALDRIEDGKKRAAITESLTLGPEASAGVVALNEEITRTAELLGVSREEAADIVDQLHEMEKSNERLNLIKKAGLVYGRDVIGPPEAPPGADTKESQAVKVGAEWKKTLDDITSTAGILNDTLGGVFNGLTQGFNEAFHDILAGTATIGSVLKSLWHGIIEAIMAELARLAAALVIRGIATALGLPGFIPTPGGGAQATSMFVAPGGDSSAAMNVTNVYAYDLRDGVRDLTSMTGSQRRASSRVAFLGEY